HQALSKGAVAVITGGASGIGLAAARRFAAFGMKLVLADLSQNALDRAAAQLPDAELVTVPTDVSKIDEVNRLKDRAYAAFGAVRRSRAFAAHRGGLPVRRAVAGAGLALLRHDRAGTHREAARLVDPGASH